MLTRKRTTLKEVGETLAFIVARMATKSDLEQLATKNDARAIIREEVPTIVAEIVDEKLRPILGQLASIGRDLAMLSQRAEHSVGLTKEIDHALERIGAIEKHLGLDKKIVA